MQVDKFIIADLQVFESRSQQLEKALNVQQLELEEARRRLVMQDNQLMQMKQYELQIHQYEETMLNLANEI